MAKRMLIDATHPEETRVVVVNGTRLEQFDVETSTKKQLKGNIYLAKVVRVEPSLQAAFVDYGGNRHGFLAFSEIHPDYYQIPVADRQALLEEQESDSEDAPADKGEGEDEDVETLGGEEPEEVTPRPRAKTARQYKIQEVIKRRQVMLVQVVKEERGNKGAALTTYLSLAGRYCVLMPNTAKGGGVSRKITSATDRKRLKQIMQDLDVAPTMAVILRTAGANRSRAEIKRDYEYLMRTWNQIRETTLESRAPCLIHEEANLIKRAIRDIYTSDIEEVLVEGEKGYRVAKDFMKLLTPSRAKLVQPYRDETMPLFHRYQVDSQLDAMHSPIVHLKSGGYIVINQTEALVAIDVNSGRATKERHIEETALKTNLEAAEEIARQLRLRDLAGLVVIDFIDMEESRNNASVERKLKEALKQDRARIQMGRISHFGLLELSRQRLRPSLMETSFETCEHCGGAGVVRSVESASVHILRVIEEEGVRRRSSSVTIHVATPVALYILNNKRAALADIEQRYDFTVRLLGDDSLISPDYRMDRVKSQPTAGEEKAVEAEAEAEAQPEAVAATTGDGERKDEGAGDGKKRRKRRKRRRREDVLETADSQAEGQTGDEDAAGEEEGETVGDGEQDGNGEGEPRKRRRRSRRGGRRRRKPAEGETATPESGEGEAPDQPLAVSADSEMPAPEEAQAAAVAAEPVAAEPVAAEPMPAEDAAEAPVEAAAAESTDGEPSVQPAPRRRVRRRKTETEQPATAATETPAEAPAEAAQAEVAPDTTPEAEVAANAAGDEKPKRRRAPRKRTAAASAAEGDAATEDKPKRRRTTRKKAEPAAAEAPADTETPAPAAEAEPEPQPEPGVEPAADQATTAPAQSEAAAEPGAAAEAEAPAQPEEPAEAEPMPATADTAEDDTAEDDTPRKPRRGWWQRLVQ